jgi:hypothetical protein
MACVVSGVTKQLWRGITYDSRRQVPVVNSGNNKQGSDRVHHATNMRIMSWVMVRILCTDQSPNFIYIVRVRVRVWIILIHADGVISSLCFCLIFTWSRPMS